MPNIAAVLKDEISRLCRKEVRAAVDAVKGVTGQHRKDLAALKQQMADLQRLVTRLVRDGAKGAAKGAAAAAGGTPSAGKPRRFSAPRLKAMRARMGLSAGDLGKLVGVSAQSIYNWEQGKARPRAEQIAKLGELRELGKKGVADRLQAPSGAPGDAGPAAATVKSSAKSSGEATVAPKAKRAAKAAKTKAETTAKAPLAPKPSKAPRTRVATKATAPTKPKAAKVAVLPKAAKKTGAPAQPKTPNAAKASPRGRTRKPTAPVAVAKLPAPAESPTTAEISTSEQPNS